MRADFDHLWQEIEQVWNVARQARAYNRMARARMTRTRQEVRRMHRRALTACMAPWMPTANAWTREITATILASHGLLDKTPARRSPAEGRTGAPPGRQKANARQS